MALVLDEKKKADELREEKPDTAAPLRADVLGSIAGADPNSPGYLGKINHLITAHGAVDRLNPDPDFSGMTSDNERGTGMHLIPPMGTPSSLMAPGATPPIVPPPDTPTTMASLNPPRRGWLGKIGHGLARMGNIAGDIFAPEVMALTSGTDLNKQIKSAREQRQSETERELGARETTAAAEKSKADTESKKEAFLEKQPKTGLTPEETTIHDLMTGDNGQPRVNQETQKPYSYLEAFQAIQNAKLAGKPDTETQEAQRYEKIKTAQKLKETVTPEDLAWAGAYEKRKTLAPFATAVAQAPQKSTERSDKSFQLQNSNLDKEATPIDQLNQRMGRLMDTINQNTPQADALVAPELLSVMSGGAGSGLRMNEAEIAQIVGGRSNWESLKASINKWSLNPSEALSITPEQRQEIRALAKTVQDKLIAKVKIVDDARDALIDSDDPKEQRRIVADAKKKLDAIDAGQASGPAGTIHYTEGADSYDIPPEKEAAFKAKHPNARKQ